MVSSVGNMILVPSLITHLALVVVFFSGSYEATSETTLSCCGEPHVDFEKGCDFHASVGNQAFATFAPLDEGGTTSECQYPCKLLEDGRMTLYHCMNVNVNVVCTKIDMLSDETKYYIEQACTRTGAPRPDVFVPLVILMVLCFTWQMIT